LLIHQAPRPGLLPQVPSPGPISVVAIGDLPHRPGCMAQCYSCVSQSHHAMHVQCSLSCGIPWECHFSPLLQNPNCFIICICKPQIDKLISSSLLLHFSINNSLAMSQASVAGPVNAIEKSNFILMCYHLVSPIVTSKDTHYV